MINMTAHSPGIGIEVKIAGALWGDIHNISSASAFFIISFWSSVF